VNSDRRGIRESLESEKFLLEFDTNSEDFIRGFECGEIWACLSDRVEYLHSIIVTSNALMVMRMVDAANKKFNAHYTFDAHELTQEHIEQLLLGPGEWMSVVIKDESHE